MSMIKKRHYLTQEELEMSVRKKLVDISRPWKEDERIVREVRMLD